MPGDLLDRVAAAPISWGVCEVPGWGYQLSADRVLAQMRDLGLAATEFGPEGFLPQAPQSKAALLASYELRAAGAFVPLVLHDVHSDPLPAVDAALEGLVTAGAGVVVLAAATGLDGYDTRPELGEEQWRTLLANADRIAARAGELGVNASLHPHFGTVVERPDEVQRLLEGCAIPLCLDTGHLLVGGTDPVELARQAPQRIAHVHLKDVDAGLATQVRRDDVSYTRAVHAGLYRPLGHGDVQIAEIVHALEGVGFSGWYVLEQDTVLSGDPGESSSSGPAADVAVSIDYISRMA